MMNRRILSLLCFVLPSAAFAYDYPTADRVEYVLECMKDHGGGYEHLYKCSCAIDTIAKDLPYEQYVESSTAARYQTLGGERGGVFRDPDSVRNLAKNFRAIQAKANNICFVK